MAPWCGTKCLLWPGCASFNAVYGAKFHVIFIAGLFLVSFILVVAYYTTSIKRKGGRGKEVWDLNILTRFPGINPKIEFSSLQCGHCKMSNGDVKVSRLGVFIDFTYVLYNQ
jgi:hypothetical protein